MNKRLASRVQVTAQSGLGNIFSNSNADLVSFAAGMPDASLFPKAALQAAFDGVLGHDRNALQYHDSLGLRPLREKLAARMRAQGTPADAKNVMLTQGAQQGIDLTARLVLNRHDGLVVEAPTYIGALASFDAYEPTYYEIPMESDGMDIDQLRKTLMQHDVKLLYVIPDFQNPTGVVMSIEKRRALIDLANRYNFIILEDSPYRDLNYTGELLPTLRSMDTEGRVISLGSFSKILAPGLRLGWLSADPELFNMLVELKAGNDVETSSLMMQGVNAYLDQNNLEAHICDVKKDYAQKLERMLLDLDTYMPAGVTYTRPAGGFFVWLTAPEFVDMGELLTTKMVPEGHVSYVPSQNLYPSKNIKNQARLNFTGQSLENIDKGIKNMAQILKNVMAESEMKRSVL